MTNLYIITDLLEQKTLTIDLDKYDYIKVTDNIKKYNRIETKYTIERIENKRAK